MAVSLTKGGNLSLSKTAPNLTKIKIELKWESRPTAGPDFDLDASVFLLQENGKVRSDDDFIFYNQLSSVCQSVTHSGDDRTGGGGEEVRVDLQKVPGHVKKLVFCATIDEAESRRQNYGMLSSAFISLVNLDNDVEVTRFDLSEDYGTETAMIFGEIYKHNDEWKFKAVGQGYAGGLEAMCRSFGVNVA